MQPKVSKGLATWAGIVAAAGQYAAAVAVFLDDPDKATALGPLTTATVTLAVVIYGRMSQARTQIAADATRPKAGPTVSLADLVEADRMRDQERRIYAGTSPRPHAGGSFEYSETETHKIVDLIDGDNPDPDPPAGPSARIADPMLDDPGLPTRAQHSHLKG